MSSKAGPGRCRVVRAQDNVVLSKPGPMSSWTGPMSRRLVAGRYRADQARADVESNEPELISSLSVLVDVESIGLGSMSSRTTPSKCRVSWAWVDVESIGPGPISSRSGPCQCRISQAGADVEPNGPGPMSSRTGTSWCRVSRAEVEPIWPGPMSSRAGSIQCRVSRARVDVKPNGPKPMSCLLGLIVPKFKRGGELTF